jgi:proline dehydrogenase
MLDTLSRATFSILAGSGLLKRAASRFGMRRSDSFARRFVAGETLAEAMATARMLEQNGLTVTIDRLGEHVEARDAALTAMRAYISVMKAMAAAGVTRNISIKLTQIGLHVDRATCIDNLRRILDVADQLDFFIRVDMEESAYTELTIDAVESVWRLGSRNIGTVIQAALRRSPDDVKRLVALGSRVRLVKGAYREPKAVAYQHKEEVDQQFIELMKMLIRDGTYPAIATHDPLLIDETRRCAEARGLDKSRYEFQFLYGIRRDLQLSLLTDGHPVRIYVPFGTEWFPYFMRRLGERPENVTFVLKNMWHDRKRSTS